jgi:hypothetical protein
MIWDAMRLLAVLTFFVWLAREPKSRPWWRP